MENDSLQQVVDIPTRMKLESIQGYVSDLGKHVVKMRSEISERRARVTASRDIADRLLLETGPVKQQLNDDKISHEEAKIRMDVLKRCIAIVQELAQQSATDLLKYEGQIDGMVRAIDLGEQRFKTELQKYERWQRIEADEKEARGEEDGGESNVVEMKPKKTKKAKKKAPKKALKAKKRREKDEPDAG